MKIQRSFATIIMLLGVATAAQSAVIVTAIETGGNVEFSASGTLNLAAWTDITITVPSNEEEFGRIRPVSGDFIIGPPSSDLINRYSDPMNFTDPGTFGTGGDAFTSTGPASVVVGIITGADDLIVPLGYVSGTDLSGTNTYNGQSFASLGMTPGTYTWSWGSGETADSLTLEVVPVPAAVWLFGSALGLLGWMRRKSA